MIEVVSASPPSTVQGVELKEDVGIGSGIIITTTTRVIFGEPTPTSKVGISGVQTSSLELYGAYQLSNPPYIPEPGPGESPPHDPDEECPDCAGDSDIHKPS